jgi:hypothetical protein
MRFKVSLMRRRGRRLPWREVMNGQNYVGELVTHLVHHGEEQFEVATLRLPGCPKGRELVPDLYEPVLIRFATLAFRLRGYERVGDGENAYSVVQEWHCETP